MGGQKQELKEVTEVHVTEDEVTALMADRRYRNAGISRILARQLVGEEKKNKEAAVIRRAEEAQYDEAVKRKGKPEMEGWGRRTAEEEAPKLAEKVVKFAEGVEIMKFAEVVEMPKEKEGEKKRAQSEKHKHQKEGRQIRSKAKHGRWLGRRPTVRLRRKGQMWVKAVDTAFGAVVGIKEQRSSISKRLAQHLGWEGVTGDEVEVEVDMGSERQMFTLTVRDKDSPSLIICKDILRWLQVAGWRIDEGGWMRGWSEHDEPMECEGHMMMGDRQAPIQDGMMDEGGEEEAWAELIDRHQREAIDGEEPGGLIQGEELAPQTELMREVWKGVKLDSVAGELPSGPKYTTAEDNAQVYKDMKQCFKSGELHEKMEEWLRWEPTPDSEVLSWVEKGYPVQEHEAALGLNCGNGKVARQNPEALQILMTKRLREGSYETTRTVKNVVPVNLVDKPTADPAFRVTLNGRPVNEAYGAWKIRYEGLKTVPLTVKHMDWLFTLDLFSGYDALLLTPESRGLFGVKIRFTEEQVRVLKEEGLICEGCVVKTFKDGSMEVLMQPRALVQGWKNSCAVFTKLLRQVVRGWRKKGFRLVHMLDDFLFAVSGTEEEANAVIEEVIADLKRLGFYTAWKKSVLKASRVVRFLGTIVDSEKMRFFHPGDKVEEIEALITEFLEQPDKAVFRKMASVAGKILSTSTSIAVARLFTRETYQCIRPEGEWDNEGEISVEMVEELKQAVYWVRRFNQYGAPIRRPARQVGLRLMMDASVHGIGYRLDGEQRDVKWVPGSLAGAAEWGDEQWEDQVHRELGALLVILEHDASLGPVEGKLRGQRILVWTDNKATEAYINKGSGSSRIMTELMKRIWGVCIKLECSVWAEYVPGTVLVEAGVDACSRASEFKMARRIFLELQRKSVFGGEQGFTVDLCASVKTKQMKKFGSRGGIGEGSIGDVRTVELREEENYFVCPPIGLIELVIKRLEEAGVKGTVVVPNWIGKAWHLWLRERATYSELLPWLSYPATWWDVAEKPAKEHQLAQRWQFAVFAVDFRPRMRNEHGVLPALGKAADQRVMNEPMARLDYGGHRGVSGSRPVRHQQWLKTRVLRVLSMCGGIGTVGWALQKLQQLGILGKEVTVEVIEIEYDEAARAMAQRLGGGVSRQATPHDLWQWVKNTEEGKHWIRTLGKIDWVVCGFSCQDMSVAHRKGVGLKGQKSSVYFAARQILQWVVEFNPEVDFTFECTNFRKKHPRDWGFVSHNLGVEPEVVEAAWIAPCYRNRAFWSSFTLMQVEKRRLAVQDSLEADRRPAQRWREKMPTIVASGRVSWNHKDCVESWVGGRWRKGSLRIGEVEHLMGFKRGETAGVMMGVRQLSERERWKGLGNAIHAAVMCHVAVSMIIARGYITRDDVRLKGQPWTINQDGPKMMAEFKRQAQDLLKEVSQEGKKAKLKTVAARQVQEVKAKKSRRSMARVAMEGVKRHGGQMPKRLGIRWKDVYGNVDSKGVPALKHMRRKMGLDKPQQPDGSEFWQFVDELGRDLMILSRAENTWKMYAAWWTVFVEWGNIMQVDVAVAMIEQLQDVLYRSLVMMWYGANYAAKTLELYTTAVSSRVRDEGRGEIRSSVEVNKILEGIKRKLGCAVHKKLPVEGSHVAAFMTMGPPAGDGEAWTGKQVGKQWQQLVAMVVLGWSCFLRCGEIPELQICDLTWVKGRLEVCVRKAKADQLGMTATTEMEYAAEGSELCLLKFFEQYLKEVMGGARRRVGCTKTAFKGYECSVCPYVFPNILRTGVQEMDKTDPRTLRRRLKAALGRLEELGLLSPGMVELMSGGSLRKGGNSTSAAYGVRDVLREKHGRWGQTCRRLATAEPEYNMQLETERGAVMSALNTEVNKGRMQKGGIRKRRTSGKDAGLRRDSGRTTVVTGRQKVR